jgi:ribonuclease BN (tRNA processing enzyme)
MAAMTPSLTLLPVGVGAAYARPGETQSAYLVRGAGRDVLVDLGAGAMNRLQRHVAPEELTAVVVTHVHPDHCADLLSLRVYMAWGPGRGRRLPVHGPAALPERLMDFAGEDGWDEAFDFRPLAEAGGTLDLGGGLGLSYRQVPHTSPTFAARFDLGASSICLGADCAPGPALPALASGCDVLVLECSFGADPVPEGVAHLNAPAAGELPRAAGCRRLHQTHCYPEHDRDRALEAAAAAFRGPVGWARQDEEVRP